MKSKRNKLLLKSLPFIFIEVATILFFIMCEGQQGFLWLIQYTIIIMASCFIFNTLEYLLFTKETKK